MTPLSLLLRIGDTRSNRSAEMDTTFGSEWEETGVSNLQHAQSLWHLSGTEIHIMVYGLSRLLNAGCTNKLWRGRSLIDNIPVDATHRIYSAERCFQISGV